MNAPGIIQSYVDIAAYRRDPLSFLSSLAAEQGDISAFKLGSARLYLLNHPDLIRELLVTQNSNFVKSRALERTRLILGDGLLTSEGDTHRHHRRMLQPMFHRDRIASYSDAMVRLTKERSCTWESGQELDIWHEMMELTLRIVGDTLFGSDVRAEAEDFSRNLTAAMEFWDVLMLPLSDLLFLLPLPIVRRFERARSQLDRTIYHMINQRKATADERDDLLSLLLSSRDTEGTGEGLTDAQVRDEALTLFTAGHETTALATTWTWYLLAGHPQVAQTLHAELDRMLGNRAPTFDDLPNLSYTRMIITEAMRLYPPAWAVGRKALHDCRIGDQTIPANSIVLASQYVMHRDSRFFPEPNEFRPERWSAPERGGLPRYAYFPFGGGSRACIGESFAWTEATLIVAELARKWRLHLIEDTPPGLRPLITLRPDKPIQMRVEGVAEMPFESQ